MLKIGVVGVGHLGQHHARKFMAMDNAVLAGIYDAKSSRAKEIAKTLSVHRFESYDALLDACDAIDIAATTTAHYELALKALQAGKHIFLEKPITSKLEEAKELLELADSNKLKIQVGHIERFNPVVMKVENEIKDPVFIESTRISTFHSRGTDVPVVLDVMIHDIDLILSFVHSPIKHIHASGIGVLTPSIDIANARIEFENGAIANVTSSRVSLKQERKIRFFQKDCYITLDFQSKQAKVIKKSPHVMKYLPKIMMGATDIDPTKLVDQNLFDCADSPKDALSMELESWVNAILTDTKPIVDGHAGANALEVAEQIIQIINEQLKKSKIKV
ncbi:MAG: Gfo/Idh/MocA family oxidoreductase [Candidatus Cloacimonetes bacterium]|jgi:predicted dehydrogenase|nr:Gfo/Idh/MocA family oxidoreductase [Candidatus Cloacimonadota bacterium]MDD4560086.1 Gfo/Idh/MocA family oxidoreductase [Candidatus Cloacimonadota bacterium]